VRFSPGAGSHTPRAWAGAAPRLGVASRLLLAFLGISALAVVGAGRRDFFLPGDRRRSGSHHGEAGSSQRWPCRKCRAKPSGLLRPRRPCSPLPTVADHAESSRKITGEMEELAALLQGLEQRGAADSVALGSMRSAVSRLQINLVALDKVVADRMVVSELKRGQLGTALITHSAAKGF